MSLTNLSCLRGAAIAVLLVALLPHARAQSRSAWGSVHLGSIELVSVGVDKAEATVRLSATASRAVNLRALAFDRVTVNGVLVQVAPMNETIHLSGDGAPENLPALRASFSFRNLESFDPFRRAIEDGRAQVHAEARAQVDLSLFEKLLLRTGGAWITNHVDQDVPINLPGGALGKLAAQAALTAAYPVWIAGQSAQEWRRTRSAIAGKARGSVAGRVMMLETRYELKSRDGETVPVEFWSAAFLVGNAGLLAPAEAVEPWSFDEAQAEAISRGDITVDRNGLEILAWPVAETGGSTPYSLKRKELRLMKELQQSETAISLSTKQNYPLRFRDRDSNAALFEITAWKQHKPGFDTMSSRDGEWQPASLIRLLQDGRDVVPSLWITEVRFEQGHYDIKDRIDSSAFGSPLWLAGGVVGMVQDQCPAIPIETVMAKLGQ
jgi:hypothetical protein